MTELRCTLNYVFSKEVDDRTKIRMQEEYLSLRDIAIDLLNPQLEHWNEEYDELYPDETDIANYYKWLSEKQREVLKYVNDAYCKGKITYLSSDPENADIVGVLMTDPSVIMHMCIVPIGDWGNLVK